MIIHNTTYSILPEIEEEWVSWVKESQLPVIKQVPGVKNCQFLKLLTEIESDGITYTIQVEIDSLAHGEAFLTEHDPALQNRVMERFPNKAIYFQTLLKIM